MERSHVYTLANRFKRLFERALRCRNGMRGEKVFDFVFQLRVAKGRCGFDDSSTAKGASHFADFRPMSPGKIPCHSCSLRVTYHVSEYQRSILRAHLRG